MTGERKLNRRTLLQGGAGLAAAAGGGFALGRLGDSEEETVTVPFYGASQAGIVTPVQDRLHFASFDLTTRERGELAELLRAWTRAAARMTSGRPAAPEARSPLAPPADTGEALDLPAARLTLTFGLGASLFDRRFGLASRRPAALRPLPALPNDFLDPGRSGGDLCVQACAEDPQVAFHAVRNLARIARGAAVMRWSQLGFGRTSTTSFAQTTPRNLMGFKDGTHNLRSEQADLLRQNVWVGGEGPNWMRGGTYLVARRIRMLIESWDRAALADQERTIGRRKESGAPLGQDHERDPELPNRLDAGSHVMLARPESNAGIRLLRRGYSFTDGIDPESGELDAGLFFISFQRTPAAFVEVQRRLGRSDLLNEYIKHVGSGLWAVPAGVRRGGWLAQGLFA